MTELRADIRAQLDASGLSYEVLPCEAEHADTAVFCEHYGYSLDDSANTIVVKAKTGEERFVACVLLATTLIDTNKVVRKRLGARRVSFASAQETLALTQMELGGVTPFCLPDSLELWVDARTMEREYVLLGGGDRQAVQAVLPPAHLPGK